MFLKSLDITGFKSFARQMRIELPSGISAFVGPNGSGKSNVVDAIRWALGEQNVRDLRAQRSDDVIYSSARRAVGMAEVRLAFEEDLDGPLSSWSGLEVSRRIYRNGDSEYVLNGARSRMRDVVTALHDAGIDTGRNLIVTQGMADSLLSAGPIERRSLLEQAAGLSGYRDRRDDAEHKLTTVLRNIETAELVLAELEPRVRLLRRHAKAIEERDEAGANLRIALTAWYADKVTKLRCERDRAQSSLHEEAQRRIVAAEALERLESVAAASLDAQRTWHALVQRDTAVVHSSERERDSLQHDIARLDREAAEVGERIKSLAMRNDRVRLSFHEAKSRRDAVAVERNAAAEAWQLHQSELEILLERCAQRQIELSEAGTVVNDQRDALRKLQGALQRSLTEKGQTEKILADLCEKLDGLNARREHIGRDQASSRRELMERQEHLKSAAEEERRLASVVAQLTADVDRATVRVERLQRLARRARALLSDLHRTSETMARTVSRLTHDLDGRLIAGLNVRPGMERAVSGALGLWGTTTVPGSDAGRLHRVPRGNHQGWRSALETQVETSLRWLDQYVGGYPQEIVNPLAVTIVVADPNDAEIVWKKVKDIVGGSAGSVPVQVVTQAGTVWSSVGIHVLEPDDTGSRLLLARTEQARVGRRKLRLSGRLSVIDRALSESAEVLAGCRDDAGKAERRLQTARETTASHVLACRDLQHVLERLTREDGQEALKQVQCTRDRDALLLRLHSLDSGRVDAETQVREAMCRLLDSEQAQSRVENEIGALRSTAADLEHTVERLRLQAESQEERALLHDAECDRLSTESSRLQQEAAQLGVRQERIAGERQHAHLRLQDVEERLARQTAGLEELKTQSPGGGLSPEEMRRARDSSSAAVRAHEQALSRANWLDQECNDLEQRLWDDLGFRWEDLPDDAGPPPDDDAVRRLRNRANAFSDADPSVIAEYQELAERSRYLAEHVADLRQGERNLRDIMVSSDREMNARFERVFNEVNREFGETFRMMLRGGEGRLEIVDDRGGIEIRAQLPGHKTRASAAFSGGERTLVASSLLFAVLRVRPSPFCVLDEVDAALDESNVDRYLAVLRELSARTQIIVVTHNRATMGSADVLYGLTMDDDGVSSLLSLRLEEFGAAV